jgi:hypothetical protein
MGPTKDNVDKSTSNSIQETSSKDEAGTGVTERRERLKACRVEEDRGARRRITRFYCQRKATVQHLGENRVPVSSDVLMHETWTSLLAKAKKDIGQAEALLKRPHLTTNDVITIDPIHVDLMRVVITELAHGATLRCPIGPSKTEGEGMEAQQEEKMSSLLDVIVKERYDIPKSTRNAIGAFGDPRFSQHLHDGKAAYNTEFALEVAVEIGLELIPPSTHPRAMRLAAKCKSPLYVAYITPVKRYVEVRFGDSVSQQGYF